MATGKKTYNGAISVGEDKNAIQTIAEKAKKAGKKVGVTTSVSVDHATPAAFYAHQADRNMNYEIALDLPKANFDFYAGGGFLKPTTTYDKKEAPSIFPIFEEAGYTVARGYNDYKAKATAVQNTEIYKDCYAISVCTAKNVSSPTVVGAQAANELLNIKNVKASFVCTPYNDLIYISARSLDKINVQVLMEEFGGGGHMNLAGAQVKDASLGEVTQMIKNAISRRIEEGDM